MKSSGIIFKQREFFGSDPGTMYEDVSREQRTCTPTALDYTELASGLWVPTFNGSTSVIDTGSDWIGVQSVTISAWLYLSGYGETSGRILDGTQLMLWVSDTGDRLGIASDGATLVYSATDSIEVSAWYHVMVTRTSAGVINFYVNAVLSGSADQDSGTPAAGTNVLIGNKIESERTFDGYISGLTVYSSIDADPTGFASNIFQSQRNLYGV